jgi:hypothetical protein
MKTIVHDRLKQFSKVMSAGALTRESTIFGMKILLRTLSQADEDEANAMVGVAESMMESSERLVRGRLAMSIVEMDEKKVTELFEPSDTNSMEATALSDSKTRERWARRELFVWLGEQDTEVVTAMYESYKALVNEKKVALRDIKSF